MMPDLLATDPNRRPPRNGDPRPRCNGCKENARRCDTRQWLRAGYSARSVTAAWSSG